MTGIVQHWRNGGAAISRDAAATTPLMKCTTPATIPTKIAVGIGWLCVRNA